MAGPYRIVQAQLPLVGGLGGHNLLVELDGNGNVVEEIDGLATDASGNVKPVGFLPSDKLYVYGYNSAQYYSPGEPQVTIASGTQGQMSQLIGAAETAAVAINAKNLSYPFLGFGPNSNSVTNTLEAAMGIPAPSVPSGAPFAIADRTLLLNSSELNTIRGQSGLASTGDYSGYGTPGNLASNVSGNSATLSFSGDNGSTFNSSLSLDSSGNILSGQQTESDGSVFSLGAIQNLTGYNFAPPQVGGVSVFDASGGGSNTFSLSPNVTAAITSAAGDSVSLSSGDAAAVSGNSTGITMNGTGSVTVTGSQDNVNMAAPNDYIGLSGAQSIGIEANGGTVEYLPGSPNSASLVGNGTTLSFDNAGSAAISGGDWNIVGNNAYINTTANTQFNVTGSYNYMNMGTGGTYVGLLGGTNNDININNGVVVAVQGASAYIAGSSNVYDLDQGITAGVLGTNNNMNVLARDQVNELGSSTLYSAGSGASFHLMASNELLQTAASNTVFVPQGLTNETVYGSNETFDVGSGVHLTIVGSNDRVDGGSSEDFYIQGDNDSVYADNSQVDFSGGGSGDDVYGTGDGGYGWDGGGGGYGYGYGYGGYGGYAFANSSNLGSGQDIGNIARFDVGIQDQSDATIAQTAKLQAADVLAKGRLGTLAGPGFEGPKWQVANGVVTWSIAPTQGAVGTPFDASLSSAEEPLVAQAFATWAAATGLKFQEVSTSDSADIQLGWSSLGGSSGALGYTSLRAENGSALPGATVSLEDPKEDPLARDASGNLAYTSTDAELEQVLLHEVGHALGFADNSDSASVMAPVLSSNNRTLDATDLIGAEDLYGAGKAAKLSGLVGSGTRAAAVTLESEAGALIQAAGSFGPAMSGSSFVLPPLMGAASVSPPPPFLTSPGG